MKTINHTPAPWDIEESFQGWNVWKFEPEGEA